MVRCATKYEMKKQFQAVYTISKFKEFQEEFTVKVYCEVVSSQEDYVLSKYEVREDIILNEGVKICFIQKR
ncbi:hypothetical protein BVC80_8837g19 [Macleaya cordata]|uniref:Uncharacterized protein n=1 Tax=Macleaya cordata TaxID=56857 RepID=A0A200RE24_MACCD|nr:hypothetical protein BVC80_8837g19 [Macleaya cordata]